MRTQWSSVSGVLAEQFRASVSEQISSRGITMDVRISLICEYHQRGFELCLVHLVGRK